MSEDEDTVVDRCQSAGLGKVYPVHRLDRGTSGVLVLALSSDAARILGRAFAERRVEKTYLALVRGALPEGLIEVDHPIPVDEGGPRAPARTTVERLDLFELSDSPLRERRYSWVRARPETGRFHQVRRHLKHLGHPLIGDANYGRSEHNRLLREKLGLGRLALHAASLTLMGLEGEGSRIDLQATLPENLSSPLGLLRKLETAPVAPADGA